MQEQWSFHPANTKRILIVDDATDTRLMLNMRLQHEGFTVLSASSGVDALDVVHREGLPHLALLDIIIPDMNGFEIAQQLRQIGDVPIIFLSAISDTETKVEGLTRFAEDYITKPFAFPELLARVRRVLMRNNSEAGHVTEVRIDNRLCVNFAQHCVLIDGQQATLTPTETKLLHVLYNNRGRVLSAGFLLARAWEPLRNGTIESLWVHIRRLRSKIEVDPNRPTYVMTVRGQGYCLPHEKRPLANIA